MEPIPSVFSFDESFLLKNGQEMCFEMRKAEMYTFKSPEQPVPTNLHLFWRFGEDSFPEMELAVKKAKLDFAHLWPERCKESDFAELIFQNVALQKTVQTLILENAAIQEENKRLLSQLQSCAMTSTPTIPEPEVSEVTMHTVCDETMTTYYNPVPGINTILSCAEGKVQIDNGPTPTLTLNVRQKMDQIRQMFFEGESEQQLSVSMGSMSTEVKDSPPLPRPQAPLHIHKDAPEEAPPICKGGLQILRDEPSAPVFVQPEKPKGLKIHKDPELIAVRGDGGDIPRQPLRTVAQIPAPFAPAEQSEASLANSPLSGGPKGDDSVVPTFTLPLVFDPTCASTAVFARPPGKSSVPPHQDCPQVQETADSDVEVRSPSPQPLSPDAPLEDVFNRFVHSPDQSGRLRIDATKFIDAFLTKKATRALGTENQRPPPF